MGKLAVSPETEIIRANDVVRNSDPFPDWPNWPLGTGIEWHETRTRNMGGRHETLHKRCSPNEKHIMLMQRIQAVADQTSVWLGLVPCFHLPGSRLWLNLPNCLANRAPYMSPLNLTPPKGRSLYLGNSFRFGPAFAKSCPLDALVMVTGHPVSRKEGWNLHAASFRSRPKGDFQNMKRGYTDAWPTARSVHKVTVLAPLRLGDPAPAMRKGEKTLGQRYVSSICAAPSLLTPHEQI